MKQNPQNKQNKIIRFQLIALTSKYKISFCLLCTASEDVYKNHHTVSLSPISHCSYETRAWRRTIVRLITWYIYSSEVGGICWRGSLCRLQRPLYLFLSRHILNRKIFCLQDLQSFFYVDTFLVVWENTYYKEHVHAIFHCTHMRTHAHIHPHTPAHARTHKQT